MPPPEPNEALDLKLLYEEAPCGLLLTDGSGLLMSANATFLKWFGYELSDLLGSQRFQDLLSVGGKIFYQTHIGPLLEMQKSVAEVKFDIKHRDGQKLPILANILERSTACGKVRQIAVFMAKDRVQYERELVLARERAEELLDQLKHARVLAEDRALLAEQMVAIVSHDLRNPLMAITLSAEAIAVESLTPRQHRLLSHMGIAVRRATRLIKDILDFTQARVGHGIRTRIASFDVHACSRLAIEELRLALPGRQLLHFEEGEPFQMGDSDRIIQFIGNLVSNAAAYGDPTLPITVSSVGKQEGFEIHVHNHGPSIPSDLLGKIFEPMTRGAQASEGIGLGLFIVSQIVNAHGGRMEVQSNDSEGTIFRGHFSATETRN